MLDARVADDRPGGRVVEVSSLRIESSLSRRAIGMLIVGGQLAFELRWMWPSGEQTRTGIDCPDELVPGRIVGSRMA